MLSAVEILAPAKVNLFLHVLGRREDGYHRIESLFAFADKGDFLRFEPASTWRLEITGPFAHQLEQEPDNLVTRAAKLLWMGIGQTGLPPVAVELVKNLPVAAGIGGGSSDAAAMLLGLKQAFDLDIRFERLMGLATNLGADVPACLLRKACLVRGIGDEIEPLGGLFKPLSVLLVNPLVPVSTKQVFAHYSGPFSPAHDDLKSNLEVYIRKGQNDLQVAACKIAPQITFVLKNLGQGARMSGSGATCVGIGKNTLSSLDGPKWQLPCTLS